MNIECHKANVVDISSQVGYPLATDSTYFLPAAGKHCASFDSTCLKWLPRSLLRYIEIRYEIRTNLMKTILLQQYPCSSKYEIIYKKREKIDKIYEF